MPSHISNKYLRAYRIRQHKEKLKREFYDRQKLIRLAKIFS